MNEIIKKNGINFGVIGGIFTILATLYAYLFDIKLFASFWLLVFYLVFFIALYIVLLNKTKKELNGVFSFKEAFTTFFITMSLALLMSTIFNIILFNVIDTELADKVKDVEIEAAVSMMEKFNAPVSAMKEQVQNIEKTDKYSIVAQLKGMIIGLLVFSILGFLFAAFFKSKPKEQF